MNRRDDLNDFYRVLSDLRDRLGGYRLLDQSDGRSGWPQHGVYFFFENGELREGGLSLRVVRVGSHALTAASRTTLWNRLSQHRGQTGGRYASGGNHRGSIFRLLVGEALLQSGSFHGEIIETWGRGNTANARVRDSEQALERAVSAYIRSMPLLWVAVEDATTRGLVERHSIALLSNRNREAADPPSVGWLGRRSSREAVRASGLWNIRDTEAAYSPPFLELFERQVNVTHHRLD